MAVNKGSLKEYLEEFGIKRIDFNSIRLPKGADEEYADDKLICPYCMSAIEYESEEIDQILKGTTYECPDCGKHFHAEGEITISTTSTALEEYVLSHWIKKSIKEDYEYMDKCGEGGVKFNLDHPYGTVEWEVWKEYAEPLLKNREIDEVNNDKG